MGVIVVDALPGMMVGDFVNIRYPDGLIQKGMIVNIDTDTIMVRRQAARREAGAIIVHARRLRRTAPHSWKLDF